MGAKASLVLGAIGVATILGACDTRTQSAAAAAVPGGAAGAPDRPSAELESCARTADCAGELRCLDQVCQRADRSIAGDYQAALGADALAAGDLDAALAAYAAAVKEYGGKPPADVDCAYGAALVSARADKEKAELAARVLHRCVLATPAASAMSTAALRAVALLDEVGLDPAHLTRPDPADVYLSRAPAAPPRPALGVTVEATPVPTGKTWPLVVAAVKAAEPALLACWDANLKRTKLSTLSIGVPLKTQYHDSGYDDEPGYYTVGLDPKATAPASDTDRCVRDAVAAAVKAIKGPGGDWAANVVVSVQ